LKLVTRKNEVRQAVARIKRGGLTIGLVPTMGAFHEGHLSLIRICRRRAAFTVVSIFVNPIQFSPGEDFQSYPRNLEGDLALAGKEGVDLVFAPSEKEMYHPGASTYVEETELSKGLCGRYRPGHFRGVTTVVAKLFNIVTPDLAVFGQKDFQQLAVIRRMVRDLDLPVEIVAAPIVREPDGLAMSSRNVYLSAEERRRAPRLYHNLKEGAGAVARFEGDVTSLLENLRSKIERETGGRVEYLSAVNEESLEVTQACECRYLAAALYLGSARLIDNVEVKRSLHTSLEPGQFP